MSLVGRFRSSDGRVAAWIAAAFALVFIAASLAVGRVALQQREDGSIGERAISDAEPAPEFDGISRWYNSRPLKLTSLRGKVVLVDFWAFSCVNCVRTIPSLRAWYERYKPFGLEVVGIHAPEFDFERVPKNVADAVRRLGVTWPVGMDNDFITWAAYENHYWPHVFFVDRKGRIRYDHVGEGDEAEQETQLRKLLAEGGRTLPAPVSPDEPTFDPHLTPEVYAGVKRGVPNDTIANPEGYRPSIAQTYRAPSDAELATAAPDGRIFLEGSWTAAEEFLRAGGPARIYLPFNARTVFMVAESSPAGEVRLLLDGKRLGPGAGDGVVRVGRSDLYALVSLPKTGRHVLQLDVAAGFSLYTFTFG